MPEDRLARARKTLPAGFQSGDASLNARMGQPFGPWLTKESREQLQIWERNQILGRDRWRAPRLNAADRIARYQREYETDRDLGDEA